MLNTSSYQLSEATWSPLSLSLPVIYLQFNRNLLSSRKKEKATLKYLEVMVHLQLPARRCCGVSGGERIP